jgi:hypothetical protein
VVVIVPSMVSRGRQRRTSYNGYQNRLTTRSELIVAGGALGTERRRHGDAET